jgi:hypothetical protein
MSKIKSLRSDLLNIILEAKRPEYRSQLEPYEAYANKLKEQCILVNDEYIKGLQNGYEVIISTIEAQIRESNIKNGGAS